MSSAAASSDPRAPGVTALQAAEQVLGTGTFADRVVDWLNPIFIKETRQAVKSKQFFGAFILLLVVSWMISLITVTSTGDQLEYGTWGRELFACYFVVLAAAILIMVPFSAFRSLMAEREDATFEPLIISALTPRQIVLGKLWSAVLQTFLFYSAIAPFMAFTALLQGFDFAYVALMLGMGLGVSVWACVGALAISAMVRGRLWQTIISLAVLGFLITVFGMMWGLAFESRWFTWNDPWLIAGLLAWITAGFLNILLLQEVAVANLTFQADNRSTGLRLICQTKFIVIWIGVALAVWQLSATGTGGYTVELITVGVVLSLLVWAAVGLFFVTEAEGLSQRVIRQLPQRPLFRVLLAPFFPGGSRGLLLVMGNLTVIALILVYLTQAHGMSSFNDEVEIPAACLLYLTSYFCYAAFGSRLLMGASSAVTPLHCRVLTLIIIAFAMVAPMFLLLFQDYYHHGYSLLFLPNPFVTLEELSRSSSSHASEIFIPLGGVALIAVSLNIPAMFRGIAEMVAAKPPQRGANRGRSESAPLSA